MKTIGLTDVVVIIHDTQEDFIKTAIKRDLPESTKSQLSEMKMLYTHNVEGKKDELDVVDIENKKVLISNIMRNLISHSLDFVVGEAEDGNILEYSETDHMAFDLAADMQGLMSELI